MIVTKTLFTHDGILYEKGKGVDGSDTSKWLSTSREVKYGNPNVISNDN